MLVFALAGLAAWAGTSYAQQPSQISAIRQACRTDYQTYCASVPTGGSAAPACLKENAQSLSAPRQQAVAAVGSAVPAPQRQSPALSAPVRTAPAYRSPPPPMSPQQEIYLLRRACGPDYRAFCSYVPVGGGRVIECLRENGPSLSRQCRSVLKSATRTR
jgi:hypothetical protein